MHNQGTQETVRAPGRPGWVSELTGAAVASVVCVAYAMSYAALLFPGALQALLPTGIALALTSAAIGAFWLAWRSQLPFAIAGPDGNTTSLLAAMAATAGAATSAQAASQNVLWLIAVTTLLCALLFLVLGIGRLGLAVRYVPYPVVGGFLASAGWLVCVGAVQVVGPLSLRAPLVAAAAFALVLLALLRKVRHPLVLPAMLVGASLAVLVGLRVAGVSDAEARAAGWLFDMTKAPHWTTPFAQGISGVDWGWIASQWLDMLSVAAVAVITVLLGASGLEVMARKDISLSTELREHGWLNIATALGGGYLSLVSVGRSAVLQGSGVRSRAAGMLCGAMCLLALAGASWLLAGVPKVVLAGFLLYLGVAIVWEWVVDVRRQVGLADWSLIIVILATTATIGFSVALLAGIVISCLNFALSYSRVGVVQHDLDGTQMRSSVQRPAAHREVLAREGGSIRVLVLRGMIFFGTASALLERMRAFLMPQKAPGKRVLVLDFSQAASADSSAEFTFTKIAQLAADAGVVLVVSGLGAGTGPAVLRGLAGAAVSGTLNDALDRAEEVLLRTHGHDPLGGNEPIATWLERELAGKDHARIVHALLHRRAVAAGETLMHEGEASDATLYLIESGRFSVTLPGQAQGRRLATLMAGTIAGEMALYDDARRSASVVAEHDSVVWALNRSVLERLHRDAPETAMRVHAFVVRLLAERVREANTAAAALQRGA